MFLNTVLSIILIKYQFCFSYISFEILHLREAAGLAEWPWRAPGAHLRLKQLLCFCPWKEGERFLVEEEEEEALLTKPRSWERRGQWLEVGF